jgi:beta-xylosidase
LKEQQQWEFENKQLKTNLENRLREIEEWRIKYSKLDEEVARNRDLAKVNNEMNSRLGLAGKEIERLNDALRMKLDEIDQWKIRLSRQ